MFVARDARGELVNVLEDKLEKQAYTCPACGGQIHLRQGPSVRTHFAHKSLKDCDFFFENESPEHLANKESLYHWLKKETKVQLEYPLSELKQIADVFVNGNLALEVQCSPLPQMVKVVYWKYCVFPIRDKKYLILQFLRTRTSVAISGNNFIIKISFG